MQCCVDDCGREATYKTAQLCQMHYFRVRRNGTVVKTPIGRAHRYVTPNGYITLYKPGHPLANKTNCVFEHRFVMWPIVGPDCRPCELCGKAQTWATCHVDHIDDNRQNNAASNLRILCRGCNVKRGFRPESHEFRSSVGLIEFEGRRDTATAWARDPRVKVSGRTILLRKAAGASDSEALFGDKITHNGRKPIPPPRKTNHKHERSNAFVITIDGITDTLAAWSRMSGVAVTERAIANRINSGWDPIEALFTPPRTRERLSEAEKALYRAKTREMKRAQA